MIVYIASVNENVRRLIVDKRVIDVNNSSALLTYFDLDTELFVFVKVFRRSLCKDRSDWNRQYKHSGLLDNLK